MAFDLVKELQNGKSVYVQQAIAPHEAFSRGPRKITDFPEIVEFIVEKMKNTNAPQETIDGTAISIGKSEISIPVSEPVVAPEPVIGNALKLNIHKL